MYILALKNNWQENLINGSNKREGNKKIKEVNRLIVNCNKKEVKEDSVTYTITL